MNPERTTYTIEPPLVPFSPPVKEKVIERTTEIFREDVSDDWSKKSRRSSSSSESSVIVKRSKSHHRSKSESRVSKQEIIIEDSRNDESASIEVGPIGAINALIVPNQRRHRRRSDRDIHVEIEALRSEQKALKFERERYRELRRADRHRGEELEIIKIGPGGSKAEIVIEGRHEPEIVVKKEKKGKMSLVRK
jgi:hypothetical protein